MKKCMGCMRDYQEDKDKCPICGYSDSQIDEELKETPEILRPGTILAGRYILGRSLSVSDFSIVYIAWDFLLLRRVAVKEYFPNIHAERKNNEIFCAQDRDRVVFEAGRNFFEEEIEVLRRHQDIPGIINVYRCVCENGTSYMVMDYLEGCTLSDAMEKNAYPGGLSGKTVMKKVMEISEQLHSRGIGHYSLSPDHIYLGGNGECTLIDFGYARMKLHALAGDLYLFDDYFTAPELLLSEKTGMKADQYSIGAMLYELLTGSVPEKSLTRRRKHSRLKMPGKKRGKAEERINKLADPDPNGRPDTIPESWYR